MCASSNEYLKGWMYKMTNEDGFYLKRMVNLKKYLDVAKAYDDVRLAIKHRMHITYKICCSDFHLSYRKF